jgi:tetratricopeptide (TPR) repeat protein
VWIPLGWPLRRRATERPVAGSARRVGETYDFIAAGRPQPALRAAEFAQALNPLALDASLATARARVALGEIDSARAVLLEAVHTHPLNSEVWAELGALESTVPGHEETAGRYLERARQLDPLGGA